MVRKAAQIGPFYFDKIHVANTYSEACHLYAERAYYREGDEVTLVTGQTAVVLKNLVRKGAMVVATPVMSSRYDNGIEVTRVPYPFIKSGKWGTTIPYEDFLQSEIKNIAHRAAENGEWELLEDLISEMEDMGIPCEEYKEYSKPERYSKRPNLVNLLKDEEDGDD